MPKENNKMQVDIDNLFKQNVNDLCSIKELYRKLKEVEEKTTQFKYIDNTLVKKLKKEYEKLKKTILDENVQVKLTNDIETINSKLIPITNTVNAVNELNINSFGVKYNINSSENDDLIQNAFNYCSDNKIRLIISDNLIVGKTITLKNGLYIKGNSSSITDTSTPRIVFEPKNGNTKLFTSNNVSFTGVISDLLFHTDKTNFWIYNKNLDCFGDLKFENSLLDRIIVVGFNNIFNSCSFGSVTRIQNCKTYNLYTSIFNSCSFSDIFVSDNYFNGGKPVNDENKGFYPELFKNIKNVGLVKFTGNWVEFVKNFLIKGETITISNNIFDYIYQGETGIGTVCGNNTFSHFNTSEIVKNFKNAKIENVIDEIKNGVNLFDIKNYGTSITNNIFARYFVDDNTKLFNISGDSNKSLKGVNIFNNTFYDNPFSLSIEKFNLLAHNDNIDNSISNNNKIDIPFDIAETPPYDKLVQGMKFKINNKDLKVIYSNYYKHIQVVDNLMNDFNFKDENNLINKPINKWSWSNSDWSDENGSIVITPSTSNSWINCYLDLDVTSCKYIMFDTNNINLDSEIKIECQYDENNVTKNIYDSKILNVDNIDTFKIWVKCRVGDDKIGTPIKFNYPKLIKYIS